MKSKIILGLAALASLAIPSFAQQTYCRLDGDGDRQICTTSGYDAYGQYYQRNFSQPVYNGYYGYNNNYGYNNYSGAYYRGYDRDDARRREHEEHERRERMEHERHEWREHHGDYDRR